MSQSFQLYFILSKDSQALISLFFHKSDNYDEYFQQQWEKLHVDLVEAWREVGDAEEAQIDSLNPAHPVSSSSHSRICGSSRQ